MQIRTEKDPLYTIQQMYEGVADKTTIKQLLTGQFRYFSYIICARIKRMAESGDVSFKSRDRRKGWQNRVSGDGRSGCQDVKL